MYTALAGRPDISYVVAALTGSNLPPFTSHLTAARRVLQYLKLTVDFRLHLNRNGMDVDIGNCLIGYSDSDWVDNSVDRKSQGGHVFLTSNGAISLQSWNQSHIAISTFGVEFIACSAASREAKWVLQLQNDIQNKDSPPWPIDCDIQGTLTLITMGIIKVQIEHIGVCYHNSGHLHRRRTVNHAYVHTDEHVADILMNALTTDKHTKFTKAMGLW